MENRDQLKSAIESMLFVWGEPLAARDAAEALEVSEKEAEELFEELREELSVPWRGLRVRRIGRSYQLVTAEENEPYISRLATPVKVKKLSQAALEVLAIIAYRQPVTKGEIEAVRGIRCDRVVEGLTEKGLIRAVGRSKSVGRPMLFGTTDAFLEQFGFSSLDELPAIEDIETLVQEEDETEDDELKEAAAVKADEEFGSQMELDMKPAEDDPAETEEVTEQEGDHPDLLVPPEEAPEGNIVLVGMPGAGKSTVGRVLAEKLGMDFVDMDRLIEAREGKTLQEIINEHGNGYFSELEKNVVECFDRDRCVVATGGSAIFAEEGIERLRGRGTVVYIVMTPEVMIKRIDNLESRGITLEEGETLEQLYDKRAPYYEAHADVIVASRDSMTAEDVADEIIDELD